MTEERLLLLLILLLILIPDDRVEGGSGADHDQEQEKPSIGFERLTLDVIGSRADGEGLRQRSYAFALQHAFTSS